MRKLLLKRTAYRLGDCSSKAPSAVIAYKSEPFELGEVLQSISVAFNRLPVAPLFVRLSLLSALLSHVLMCDNSIWS